ncbi:hypothetical protein [Nannocystis punicea]|uniref:Uncharacterized protein n=1 Tax=Nannocystis punicea TaxID=2995304 RepID=A0ABY7HEP6_9BACT|nr:hypothetical protein [Nannocystis poenicansa]WAS97555.1 hypothetical protein O0S08_15525 [Nannocystis poenicansa]
MVRRAALLLVLAVLGCAPTTTTQAPPERPEARAEPARTQPRRPPPAFVQALAELERNPNLCLRLVGPRAEPVRKAMLRAARGRVDEARIVAETDPVEPVARSVEFHFFVPPAAPASGVGLHTIHAYMPQ